MKSITTKKTISYFQILKKAITLLRINPTKIIAITAIVAIPGSILRVAQLDTTTNASLLSTFSGMFLIVSLTWAFLNEKDLSKRSFANIYVISSSRILPFIATTILVSLIGIQLVVGAYLVVLSMSGLFPFVVNVAGIIIILISLYLLLRLSLSMILVVGNDITSIGSLKLSWKLTKGNLLRLLFAWVAILLTVIIIGWVFLYFINLIPVISSNSIVSALCDGIILTIVTPILISYEVELTKSLQ